MLHEYDDSIILSICVMSYNRGYMLWDTVQEMLEYEGDDIEIIISDNASTDGTWETLNQIHDKRVHIYQNEKNMGMSYNAVQAQTLASGKYVMLMTDRDRLNMRELRKFVRVLEKIDKDIIIANATRYLKSDFATYQQRVYECTRDANHPGWWIYSRMFLEKVDDKLHGKWVSQDIREQSKIGYYILNLRCQNNRWFCYCGESLIIMPPLEKLATIQSNRTDNIVTKQIYFGLEARVDAFKKQIEMADVKKGQLIPYIKGSYAGNIFRVFEEYFWTINQPELCKRYNYVPPKHIWWFKNGIEFWVRIRKYLIRNGKCNKEIDKYLFCEMLRQYLNFKKNTSKIVRTLLNCKILK